MNKKIPKIVMVVVFIALSIFAFRWVFGSFNNKNNSEFKMYGNVELRDVQLSFNEQEKIVELMVDEGKAVKKGQILGKLDNKKLLIQIDEAEAYLEVQRQLVKKLSSGVRPEEIKQAKAKLAASKAKVKNAVQLVKRLETTSGSGATTKQKLDDAKTQLDMANEEVKINTEGLALAKQGFRKEDIEGAKEMLKAKEAKLAFLNERLKDTVLTAPADGVIESRILEVGEIANPSKPVFLMALTNPKWIRAYIPEPSMGMIREGMKAKVLSDSFPDKEFEGTVGFISSEAEFTPKSVQTEDLRTQLVFEIRINVDDSSNALRLGMPVTVKIEKQGTIGN